MNIEIEHRFRATHQHELPSGMGKAHAHRWVLTVRLDGFMTEYGWIADFDVMRATLRCIAPSRPWWKFWGRVDYVGTTEQILIDLMKELSFVLPHDGSQVAWARLQEKPGQAVVYEPAREVIDFGGVVR